MTTAADIYNKVTTDKVMGAVLSDIINSMEASAKTHPQGELAGFREFKHRTMQDMMSSPNVLKRSWAKSGYPVGWLDDLEQRERLFAYLDKCMDEDTQDTMEELTGMAVREDDKTRCIDKCRLRSEKLIYNEFCSFLPNYYAYEIAVKRIMELERLKPVEETTVTTGSVEAISDKVEAVAAPDFTTAGLSAIFNELKPDYIKGRETDWLALCYGEAIDGSTLKWVYRNGRGIQALAELLLMIGIRKDNLFAVMERYFGVQYLKVSSLTSKLDAGAHSAAYDKLFDIVNKHRAIK